MDRRWLKESCEEKAVSEVVNFNVLIWCHISDSRFLFNVRWGIM